jgi:hypothetical protein
LKVVGVCIRLAMYHSKGVWLQELVVMSRPEGKSAPDVYYDETEAQKYDSSSRMRTIQVASHLSATFDTTNRQKFPQEQLKCWPYQKIVPLIS